MLGVSGYPGGQSLVQSLYSDLGDYDELTLQLWTCATGALLDERILPSAKQAMNELLSLELPFAGFHQLKPMTMAAAIAAARGSGVYVLGQTQGIAGQLATSDSIRTAFITAGAGDNLTLLFIGFAATSPDLERAMARGFRWFGGVTSAQLVSEHRQMHSDAPEFEGQVAMTTTERILVLITELRELLDTTETRIATDREAPEERLRQVESILVEFRRWRPDVMYLTGPGGYNPQPAYEKCDTCGHYRLP